MIISVHSITRGLDAPWSDEGAGGVSAAMVGGTPASAAGLRVTVMHSPVAPHSCPRGSAVAYESHASHLLPRGNHPATKCDVNVNCRYGTGGSAVREKRVQPHCARWSSFWSARTSAIIASTTGVPRMPTHGSCRPLVTISLALPSRVIVSTGVRIELVGLNATRTTTRWPVEMPPAMPPAWVARDSGLA